MAPGTMAPGTPNIAPSNGNLLDIPVVPYPNTLAPGQEPVRVKLNQ